ncbi:MAG TPA: HlyD family efflux transporter periplasmic adaptor subunit, partial [Moorella mulderi]|nr:HlyD family efflux transporter periplasmic adaptor subunit [Moorella mulderi]
NIKEGDFASPGTPLFRLATREMRVVAEVGESDLRGIRPRLEAKVTWGAYPGREWGAAVERLDSIITRKAAPAGETFLKVYLRLQEVEHLLPGATVEVSIYRTPPHKAILVPLEGVLEDQGEKYVFVVENNSVQRRKVEVGGSNELFWEIKGGLSVGDLVVQSPETVREGQRVRPER